MNNIYYIIYRLVNEYYSRLIVFSVVKIFFLVVLEVNVIIYKYC